MADSEETPRIRLEVFGELRVWVDALRVEVASARQQLVLARLFAARGRSVSLPNLIDTVWPDVPPSSASNQIHRYVGERRRLFEPGLKPREIGTVLLPSASGYRLALEGVESDLEEFFGLIDEQRTKVGDAALESFDRILGLARRPAFASLAEDSRARPEFAGIDRERIAVAVSAADCALSLRDARSLPTLLEIGKDAPIDEPLQARLVRLLDLAGRPADALSLFEKTRNTLANELGISPGLELSDAHRDVLRADAARAEATSELEPVRNLPPRRAGFVETAESAAAFEDFAIVLDSKSSSTAIISGMAGIGKTTLAINWAHDLAQRFPDGQLYVNLRGFDSTEDVETTDSARDLILEAMDENLAVLEPSPAARQARYRSILDARRILIVLDNARDAEQVRPLLAGASGSFTIVTSRNQLSTLIVREGSANYPLARWSETDSMRLLGARLGPRRADAERESLRAIAKYCSGLPLALAIMSSQASLRPTVSLQEVASQMESADGTLNSLVTAEPDDDLRAVFAWSYTRLSVEAAMVFRISARYRGPYISLNVAASMCGLDLASLRPLVRELTETNMIIPLADGGFGIHDMLRAYAFGLLGLDERLVAEEQLIGYYVASLRTFWLKLGLNSQVPLPEAPPVAVQAEQFESRADGGPWYQRERDALVAILDTAWERSFWIAHSWIVVSVKLISQDFDSWGSTFDLAQRGLSAAETSGSLVHVAEACRDVGFRFALAGDQPKAVLLLQRSRNLFEIVGNYWGVASSYRTLAATASISSDAVAELNYARLGLDAARRSGASDVLGGAIQVAAHAYFSADEFDEAIALKEEGMAATESSLLLRAEFSHVMAATLNAVGSHAEAFEMTTWGRSAFDLSSSASIGHHMERAIAAAGIEDWEALREAGEAYETISSSFSDRIRELNGDEVDNHHARLRAAVARLPK